MPYPHFEDSPAYEDALSDIRAQKWLDQQKRHPDYEPEDEGDDDEQE